MSLLRLLAAAILAVCAWTSPAAAAALEAYGKLPSIETAAISPSGLALALVVTDGEERLIAVQDLTTGKLVTRVSTGSAKVRAVRWAGDRHLLLVTSVTAAPMFILNARREWTMGYLFEIGTGKTRLLLRDVEYAMNALFDMPVVRNHEGKPAIFAQGVRLSSGPGRLSLYRIDIDTAKSRLVEEGSANTRDWLVGADGVAAAHETYEGRSGRWTLKLRHGSGWREAASAVAPIDPPHVVGLGRDGRSVLYATGDGEGGVAWREARLDGSAAEAITILDDQSPIVDPQDGRLVGHAVLMGDEQRYTFFDPADERTWKAVRATYPGDRVRLESWSNDRRKIVVLVDSATEGPAYALVDLGARKATWIGAEYVGLTEKDIALKEPVRFKARDGLELSGYLTRPRDKPAKALPLIVFPHGGPAARDDPGFDWWAQGMASRGYAVLQVNFRGSDGLGQPLLRAGYGQWGRKMQTDLSDGVRHLAERGVIDPGRVCIVGASYGGYAALAGATLDRGIYRCAVSVAGVSDLRRQVTYSRTRGGLPTERYWNRFMGAESRGDAVLDTYSPARLAEQADIPILLIHGKDDTVVPLEQSRVMADALRKAGKSVELVVQPGADHWLSRGDTRLQTLSATVAFLEKHNPPK